MGKKVEALPVPLLGRCTHRDEGSVRNAGRKPAPRENFFKTRKSPVELPIEVVGRKRDQDFQDLRMTRMGG
jgi:hypothetical protein